MHDKPASADPNGETPGVRDADPASQRVPEPDAGDYTDLGEYQQEYERWALAEFARRGRSGEPAVLAWIREQAERKAACAADWQRQARQREAEREIWRVTVGEPTWRRWEEVRAWAVRHAEMGLPVVRLWGLDEHGMCACTNARWAQRPKPSCAAPGKHPASGYQEAASCDPAEV